MEMWEMFSEDNSLNGIGRASLVRGVNEPVELFNDTIIKSAILTVKFFSINKLSNAFSINEVVNPKRS